jgi:hypothetical protein
MNFICKIIEDFPDTQQISVKFCRQNSPKSIDEYSDCSIDYSKLDFTDYESFVHSLMLSGHQIIIDQLVNEPTLPSNLEVVETNSTNISDNLDKILCRDGRDIVPSESYYYKVLAQKVIPNLENVDDIDDILSKQEVSNLLNKIELHNQKKERARNEDGTYVADDPLTLDINEAWVTSTEQPKKKTKRGRKKSSET